jgi:HK97 family phage portal protein
MNLLNPLWRYVANHVKAFISGPGGAGFISSGPQQSTYNYPRLDRAYEINPWVNACVQRIADCVAAIPLRVYREQPDGESEEVTNHPLVDLLWHPGRFTSAYDLIHKTAANLSLQGQFYWFVENGTGGKSLFPARPTELRVMRSDSMKITPDPLDIIKEYVYSGGGANLPLKVEFIVHGKNYNPADDYYGLPPMQVAQSPVLLEHYLSLYNQMFFQNSARPDMALVTEGALNDDARKLNLEAWNKAYRGLAKSHGVAILDRGTKPTILGTNAKDGEFLGLDKLSREQICAIFQVPPVMVGVFEFANYANSEQQIQIFYEFTIKPMCSRIKDAINTQLIPVWYSTDKGLYVEFDYSDLKPLQADALKQAQVDQIQVNTGIKTVNEIRGDMDLPPVEWGDEPRPQPSAFGLGGLGGADTAPMKALYDLALGRQVVTNSPIRVTALKALLAPTRADQWKAHDRDLIRAEAKIENGMRGFFRSQRDRIVGALDPSAGTIRSATNVRDISVTDLFAIFDIDAENKALVEFLRPLFEQIISAAGDAAIGRVGSSVAFNLKDPAVEAFLASKLFKVQNINAVTRELLREALVAAAADSLTVAETARGIRDMFDEFSLARSLTIARTETASAQNAASMEGYAQSGVVEKKEWLAVQDDVTRDSHSMVDGDTVSLGGLFANGLMFPGDPNGPPEEVINCIIGEDTPVETDLGSVPISSVHIGDMVLTHKGNWQRVTRLSRERYFTGQALVLRTAGPAPGQPLTVTLNHRILTRNGWVVAGEIREGDEVLLPAPIERLDSFIGSDLGSVDFGVDGAGPPAVLADQLLRHCDHKFGDVALDNEVGLNLIEDNPRLIPGHLPAMNRRPVVPDWLGTPVGRPISRRPMQEANEGGIRIRDNYQWDEVPPIVAPAGFSASDGNDTLGINHRRQVGSHDSIHSCMIWRPVIQCKRYFVSGERLFNFSVADDESYFAAGIAVHNCRCTVLPVVMD